MSRRHEQELHKLQWHHVLPIGPYGIQPFVQPGHGQAARAGWRLGAGIGATLRQIAALGRWTVIALAKRPMRASIEPPTPSRAPLAMPPTLPRPTAAPRPATKAAELATQAGRRVAPIPPERTETIEGPWRHRRETKAAYAWQRGEAGSTRRSGME